MEKYRNPRATEGESLEFSSWSNTETTGQQHHNVLLKQLQLKVTTLTILFRKSNIKGFKPASYRSKPVQPRSKPVCPTKDLYSRKDMNLARFNIDCMYVAWREQVRLPIVQFIDDAHALINGENVHHFNILNQYL